MSLSYYYDQVSRLEREIADLQKKISDETRREVDKQKQIDSINRSINSSTSLSTLQSKQRQIQSYQGDIIRIQSAKADIQRKIADKGTELAKKKQEILKEEVKERDKLKREQENFQREQEAFQRQQENYQRDQERLQRKLQNDISNQKDILNTLVQQIHAANTTQVLSENKEYDFFISHATEDKESFVRPLAESLIEKGHKVWYDEFQLKIGDSLRKKIDEGLKSSKYGIVVLSRDFFKKNWPEYELNGLVAREMNGVKVILPIWHNVTRDEVISFSPTLADKLALNTAIYSTAEIVTQLGKLLEN
ncbi:TIR domain-containing protein [Ferruginibacter lapsinanis]|uniref:TIR domain-containing protein n=1 Tax=Ferruginibacter lapsinanis TaxID=563172 RepID=UPI001E2EF663|nr:TIR domain-containing protein [Ferruginibacter lapsinanis]UEG49621.1 TIR domain-containing protein [Ferruginibacter lapsinanis]